MSRTAVLAIAMITLAWPHAGFGRTIYKCWRDGSPSVSTLPEPGSRCTPEHFEDGPRMANAWQELGVGSGTLYARSEGGKTIYSSRKLPGAKALFRFVVRDNQGHVLHRPDITPPGRATRPFVAYARMGVFDAQFKQAARRYRIEEAWLRAVAHAESGYSAHALSPKGAMGVMQLMPATATRYGVKDPYVAHQSIDAGARHLAHLLHLYAGNKTLAAAAYNAGVDAVSQYKGVPPYAETREYVHRVEALYLVYQKALD